MITVYYYKYYYQASHGKSTTPLAHPHLAVTGCEVRLILSVLRSDGRIALARQCWRCGWMWRARGSSLA